jgi:hypothetical protein
MLAAVAAVMSALKTVTKFRTRRDLSSAVRKNAIDLHELNDQLDAKNFDAAEAVIRKHFGELTPAERREAETALTQPSANGRASYIRGVGAMRKAS